MTDPQYLEEVLAEVREELRDWESTYARDGMHVTEVFAADDPNGDPHVVVGLSHREIEGERIFEYPLSYGDDDRLEGLSDAALSLSIALTEEAQNFAGFPRAPWSRSENAPSPAEIWREDPLSPRYRHLGEGV